MALSKKDYTLLSNEVKRFNNEVDKLEKLESKLIAPEKININDLKNQVITKQGLNSALASLRKFNANSVDAVTLASGETITDWERDFLKERQARAISEVTGNISEYNKPGAQGISRAQMGSTTYNQLSAQKSNLESLFDKNINKIREKLANADVDSELRRARLFKENYLATMEKYRGFDGFEDFMNHLQSIRNPKTFYKYVSKNELTKDLTYQSDQTYSQQEFNNFLEVMGVKRSKIDENSEAGNFYSNEMIYRKLYNETEGDIEYINDIKEEFDLPF